MKIGITLGDPTGIGPELVARVVAGYAGAAQLIVYGDRGVLAGAAERIALRAPPQVIEVTALGELTPGQPTPESGSAQIAYLERAVADALAARLDALVTAPIHKASCIAAGFPFPGHTELLAARFGVAEVTMMLAGPRLRVALVTVHRSLASVPAALTREGVAGTIVRTARALTHDFGLLRPRLAVAALNPHAGEAGHFGDEEARVIAPAIADARAELGADAQLSGPHVPDVVFREAAAGCYDAVVAQYHDQGLIPAKLLDFDATVNVTLGLPIVRTSPDHGVAHDLAGSGRARPASLAAALALAERMVTARKR
jgi:4-hydroxythreonine-4-phosphate dehydrogenase